MGNKSSKNQAQQQKDKSSKSVPKSVAKKKEIIHPNELARITLAADVAQQEELRKCSKPKPYKIEDPCYDSINFKEFKKDGYHIKTSYDFIVTANGDVRWFDLGHWMKSGKYRKAFREKSKTKGIPRPYYGHQSLETKEERKHDKDPKLSVVVFGGEFMTDQHGGIKEFNAGSGHFRIADAGSQPWEYTKRCETLAKKISKLLDIHFKTKYKMHSIPGILNPKQLQQQKDKGGMFGGILEEGSEPSESSTNSDPLKVSHPIPVSHNAEMEEFDIMNYYEQIPIEKRSNAAFKPYDYNFDGYNYGYNNGYNDYLSGGSNQIEMTSFIALSLFLVVGLLCFVCICCVFLGGAVGTYFISRGRGRNIIKLSRKGKEENVFGNDDEMKYII